MEIRILIVLLAFILTIAALGTFLYVYFRHEQNKVISQAQSDEARNEYFERRNRRFSTPTAWSHVVSRFLIFYSTFVGFIVFFLFSTRITNGAGILEIISLVLLVVVASPLILVFFPSGLEAFFMPNAPGGFVWHILYVIICFLGLFAKDRRSFTIIYLIFIMLLILNSRGCSRMS